MKSALTTIPNVGPAVARKLQQLDITVPADLRGQDPDELFERLCRLDGHAHDPRLLDTFTAAVSYADGGPAQPWWYFGRERKCTPGRRPARLTSSWRIRLGRRAHSPTRPWGLGHDECSTVGSASSSAMPCWRRGRRARRPWSSTTTTRRSGSSSTRRLRAGRGLAVDDQRRSTEAVGGRPAARRATGILLASPTATSSVPSSATARRTGRLLPAGRRLRRARTPHDGRGRRVRERAACRAVWQGRRVPRRRRQPLGSARSRRLTWCRLPPSADGAPAGRGTAYGAELRHRARHPRPARPAASRRVRLRPADSGSSTPSRYLIGWTVAMSLLFIAVFVAFAVSCRPPPTTATAAGVGRGGRGRGHAAGGGGPAVAPSPATSSCRAAIRRRCSTGSTGSVTCAARPGSAC